jgi:hypothetical protein
MRVAADHRGGFFFDDVGDVSVGIVAAESANRGRREDDVADETQTNQKDVHF